MIRINKITTKMGDKGKTLGPNCKMMEKSSIDIELLGKLDELNCAVGKIIIYEKTELKNILEKIQHQIFDIGAMFFKNEDSNCNNFIRFLEENIESLNANLPELTSFILPNGNELIIALHEARCKTRNTERIFWKTKKEKLNNIGIYLNRLSDLFFAMIRKNDLNAKLWVTNNK